MWLNGSDVYGECLLLEHVWFWKFLFVMTTCEKLHLGNGVGNFSL